jgi:hypothetical protein
MRFERRKRIIQQATNTNKREKEIKKKEGIQ